MMEALFIKLLNISITAIYLILSVIILRKLFKRTPKWIGCMLWIMVGVRLAFPFSVESIFSLIPSTETVPPSIMYTSQPRINSGIAVLNQAVNPMLSDTTALSAGKGANAAVSLIGIAAGVWVIGMGVLLLYAAISYIILHLKLRMAIRLKDNVW